jgi:hypothetical protein
MQTFCLNKRATQSPAIKCFCVCVFQMQPPERIMRCASKVKKLQPKSWPGCKQFEFTEALRNTPLKLSKFSVVRLKSVVKPFAEWRRGKCRCKTLPFYTIRKTWPPRSLGRLFIVIGFGLFKTSADGMYVWWWWLSKVYVYDEGVLR